MSGLTRVEKKSTNRKENKEHEKMVDAWAKILGMSSPHVSKKYNLDYN